MFLYHVIYFLLLPYTWNLIVASFTGCFTSGFGWIMSFIFYFLLLLLQDVFTSGFGWIIFGGLPYDLVNTNKSLWELKIFIGDLFTLFTSFHVKLLIMYYVLLSCSSMFLVNHLASLGPVCMPIVRYKENEDKFHFEIRHRIWISLPSFSYIVYKKDKF